MKILVSNELTETAPGVRIAREIARRVSDTVARLRPFSDGAARLSAGDHDPRGEAAVAAEREAGEQVSPSGPLTCNHPGARPSEPRPGTPSASPRLIVAPQGSGGTFEDVEGTERLALSSRVPTLVVHDPTRILAWLSGTRPLRVLCAHDLTSVADEALCFVRQLSRIGGCEVTLAHVHRSVEQVSHPGCPGVGAMRRHDLEMRVLLERRLQVRAQAFLGDLPVATRVSPAPFRRDDFILDVIRDNDFDLVVSPLHPRAESGALLCTATSRTLLRFAGANLILVPPALISPATPGNGMRRVLVVADLTPADARVVAQARTLLGPGGKLRFLHVLHPHAVSETDNDGKLSLRGHVAAHLRLVESSSERLRALAQNEANAMGMAVESEVIEHRDRAVAIAHAAECFNADLVCLALAERPTLLARLVGSQVRRILRKARRSLLIVQPTTA